LACQLEYNGFTGEAENWALSNTFQIPQHWCRCQLLELEFRYSKAKHCWGQDEIFPQRLGQLLLLLRSLYCDDLEMETTRLRVFLRR